MRIPGILTPTPSSDVHGLLGRRGFLALALGSTAALALPGASFALTDTEARALISRAITDVNAAIDSGKQGPALYADFENLFTQYADVSTIARVALGPAARQASRTQMAAFTQAFTGYISRKYGKRFHEFIGAKFEVKGAQKVKSFYEVNTEAYLRGQEPFQVVWQVSDKSGKNLFFNIIIEGVNMLAAERTEIGSMLDANHGDIDALIKAVRTAG